MSDIAGAGTLPLSVAVGTYANGVFPVAGDANSRSGSSQSNGDVTNSRTTDSSGSSDSTVVELPPLGAAVAAPPENTGSAPELENAVLTGSAAAFGQKSQTTLILAQELAGSPVSSALFTGQTTDDDKFEPAIGPSATNEEEEDNQEGHGDPVLPGQTNTGSDEVLLSQTVAQQIVEEVTERRETAEENRHETEAMVLDILERRDS